MSAHAQPVRTLALLVTGLLVAALCALGLAGGTAGPASAQDYPPEPEVVVGTPGAVITIRGTDWSAGTEVEVTYRDAGGATAAAVATTAPDGTFVADLTVPADAAEGEADVSVQGIGSDGQPREQTPRVVVQADGDAAGSSEVAVSGQAPGQPVPSGTLSSTGLNPAVALTAVALLGAGAAALLAARRRRHSL